LTASSKHYLPKSVAIRLAATAEVAHETWEADDEEEVGQEVADEQMEEDHSQ
jgi:hypothetical protein